MARGRRSSSWSSPSKIGQVKRCRVLLRGCLLCAWCLTDPTPPTKLPGRDLEVDHVVPREQGGGLGYGNLVPACPSCNLARALGELEARLSGMGVTLRAAWAEVSRQTALPTDGAGGLDLARLWYPTFDATRRRARRAWVRRRALFREQAEREGLGGGAFPFGAAAE